MDEPRSPGKDILELIWIVLQRRMPEPENAMTRRIAVVCVEGSSIKVFLEALSTIHSYTYAVEFDLENLA